ncbi:nocardicin N-oxygenase [Actinocorallia herbida]|uniref:Nocardicin N-oxygenase n=1 Tax=Actinocorallia herbida TaxID=58109 RepID=A0A3N1D196_9ACTN|nr:cytochrome P450 [Actinocorallia herbida]ROO87270.1 nocardicin N-oxygenase [Actinocorallia herbida]
MSHEVLHALPSAQNTQIAEQVKRAYAALRPDHDVVRVEFPFGGPGWMTLKYDLTREFYNDPRFSIEKMTELDDYPRIRQTEKSATASFLQYDGAKHQSKRAVLMKHLTVKRVMKLRPQTERMVLAALEEFEAQGNPADVTDVIGRMLPMKVLCALLGSRDLDREVMEASYFLVDSRAQTMEEVRQAYQTITGFFNELYEDKKRNPDDGLMSTLIHDTESGRWTEEELRGLGFTLLAAGHDATGSMLNGMLEWLSYEPDLYARLRSEPEAFPRALEELLRCTTVGIGVARGRIALEDIEIGGVQIKAGDAVGGNLVASHHDPDVYPNPDVLDIDRVDPAPHMAFGYGPHACVGAQLARMEITVALQAILRRYKTFTNVLPAEGWRERRGMKGPQELVVRWEKG